MKLPAEEKTFGGGPRPELEQFYHTFKESPAMVAVLSGPQHIFKFVNDMYDLAVGNGRQLVGRPIAEALSEIVGQGFVAILDGVYNTGKPYFGNAVPVQLDRQHNGLLEERFFDFVYQPITGEHGASEGIFVHAIDVTEHVTLRKRIEESEKRFRALVTASSDVVYSMSPDWRVMRQLQGRGFLSDTSATINDWVEQYIFPEDKQAIKIAIEHAIATKSIFEREHRVILADGSIGWAISRAVPILDGRGDIAEWFGAASDITARKKIEEDLKATKDEMESSKRLYEAITGSTPDLIYVFDRNYKFIYANKALLNMWGRTWEESKGLGLLPLGYEPWHAEMHEREIDQVIATKKSIRGEVSFPHATLGKRIYDYIFAPVLNEDGEVEVISGTTRDISDQKLAEEALKQSEEQFRTLTDSLPQLIWTAGKEGNCDFFNRQWYDYTGGTEQQSYGDSWLQYIHPNHKAIVSNKWRESRETGKAIVQEFELKGKDGAYKWFYILGNPIKDDDGKITKWVGTLTNIEEQKEVEERLERLVNERTMELKRSNDDLLQFAHVTSHDLKEPVRKVKTFVNRLQSDEASVLSDRGKTFVSKILSAADRMYYMIDGVLNYSSMSNMKHESVPVNLNEIIDGITDDLDVLIQQKRAKIVAGALPTVDGTTVLIYQLFYNLINNSLKFSKADVPPEISINAQFETVDGKQFYRIDVADNGIGFPAEFAERIFDTFTRLNAKDAYEGTGLGLALCKKIAERHGGNIRASSNEGEGAMFSVWLPAEKSGR